MHTVVVQIARLLLTLASGQPPNHPMPSLSINNTPRFTKKNLEQLVSTLGGETHPELPSRSLHPSMLEERTGIFFGENNPKILKKNALHF